jgi:hypothetical protein
MHHITLNPYIALYALATLVGQRTKIGYRNLTLDHRVNIGAGA